MSSAEEFNSQPVSPAEQARRTYQWEQLVVNAPTAICVFAGPEWVYEFVNPRYQAMFPGRALLGRRLVDALPEVADQPLMQVLHRVYQTGEPFEDQAVLVPLARTEGGPVEDIYFDLSYQARRNEQGQIDGFVTYATDVTTQEQTRRQVLALNQQLDQRVLARTQELADALAQNEQDNRQGTERLQAIFAQAPVGISLYEGPAHVVALANADICAMYGHSAEQVLGHPLLDAVPELRGQGVEQLLDDVTRTGQPYVGTEVPAQLHRAGEGVVTRYFDFVYQALRGASGQPLGVLNIAYDVTEQVLARQQIEQLSAQAHAARQEAERRHGELERVFAQAPAGVWVAKGRDYVFELFNPQMGRILGPSPAQALGRPYFEVMPELVNQGIPELLNRVWENGEVVYIEEYAARLERHAPDQMGYFTFVFQPLRDEQGQVTHISCVALDVTAQVVARQRVEQLNQGLEQRVQERTRQLSEQQALLGRILGQVPAAIATLTGPEHRFTFANTFYRDLVGGREVVGQLVGEVLPEVVEQGFIALLDEVYRTAVPFIGQEVPIDLTDHATGGLRQRFLNFVYQPLPVENEQAATMLVFAVDVTEQVQARHQVEDSQAQVLALNEQLAARNNELYQSNTRLTRTNTDLDTFVYTASHDLKAPITNIEGVLAALRENLPPAVQHDEVVAHLLGLLDTTVSRFLLTIDQLTDIARLQRAYAELAEQLALAPVVAGVVEDLAPALTASAAALHVAVPDGLRVSFAPASLRSIIYNLLSNALKYRDPARPAEVWLRATTQPDGAVVLEVQDNGLGLSASQQERLFQVFQRLHTHVAGTGVGLYMIKRLIDNAGASIAVTSSPGVGSTFIVTFPA